MRGRRLRVLGRKSKPASDGRMQPPTADLHQARFHLPAQRRGYPMLGAFTEDLLCREDECEKTVSDCKSSPYLDFSVYWQRVNTKRQCSDGGEVQSAESSITGMRVLVSASESRLRRILAGHAWVLASSRVGSRLAESHIAHKQQDWMTPINVAVLLTVACVLASRSTFYRRGGPSCFARATRWGEFKPDFRQADCSSCSFPKHAV